VVVLGKGRVACETSELLARRRKKEVTIIHPGQPEELASDMEPIFERRLLLERLRDFGVTLLDGTSIIKITPEGVQAQGQTSEWIPCDHVVLEEAPVPNRSLLDELQGKTGVIGVGDCLAPRDIYQAIHDGFRAGYRLE
jgi:thioredoxin reductase